MGLMSYIANTENWNKAERTNTYVWALRIDNKYKDLIVSEEKGIITIANQEGIDHGLGDVLICKNVNGKPDFDNIEVVNGLEFDSRFKMK